jgi:hypothetical protein
MPQLVTRDFTLVLSLSQRWVYRISNAKPILITLIPLIVASCVREYRGTPPQSETAGLVFFYVINETGKAVDFRVSADGDELTTRRVPGEVAPSAGKQSPARSSFPALEIKTSLRNDAKHLEVELIPSGVRKTFDIAGFRRLDAGFQIVVDNNDISLTQDYYPIR